MGKSIGVAFISVAILSVSASGYQLMVRVVNPYLDIGQLDGWQ